MATPTSSEAWAVGLVCLMACSPTSSLTSLSGAPSWEPERRWVDVNTVPCALDDAGDVECWPSQDVPMYGVDLLPMENLPVITQLGPGTSRTLFGLAFDGRIERLSNCDFPESDRVLGCRQEWSGGFSHLAGHFARREDGSIEKFDELIWADGVDPAGPWLSLGTGATLGLDTRHQLRVLVSSRVGVQLTFPMSLDSRPVALAGSSSTLDGPVGGGCVLTDDGAITCVGASVYTDGPFSGGTGYRWLEGGGMTMCAVRSADDVVECHDGSTYSWGPLRDFAAQGWHYLDEDGRLDRSTDLPTVCVITEANTLHCEGPRIDDSVQAQLAEVNERYGNPYLR